MCRTIKQKVKFRASPLTIYHLLIQAKKHRAFSGEPVRIEEAIGGRFSLQGGSVVGINVDLLPGKRIVQAWRDHRFPPGIFSMAAFTLTLTEDGGTELILTHRGVPKDLILRVSLEWRKNYWEKIKKFIR